MVSVDISQCARCGGNIPPSAPLGLCKSCFRITTGLSEEEWERRTSLGLPRLSQESVLPEPSSFEAGQKFGGGRYELVRRLGQGGMGDVWLANDLQLNKPVALKFLADRIRLDPRALKLLRDEVVLCQELSHPNVLRIYDWKEHADEPVFVAMEYVDGGTLEERLIEQPGGYFSWIALAPYAKQLCDGLKYAHDRKVVHRDIKPRNLLITGRNVLKLADFGLARVAAAGAAGSADRTSGAGTLAYMSPQQRAGDQATVADDIYAVGATLYELLTGSPPPSLPPRQPVRQTTWPKAPMVRDAVGLRGPCDVPKPVQEAIAACLEFERGRRPWNVYQLAQRMGLEQSDWGEAPAAGPRGPQPTSKWWPRIKIATFIGLGYALLLLVGPRVMERVWTKPNEQLRAPEAKLPPVLAESPPPQPAVNPPAANGPPVPVTLAVTITNVTAPPPTPSPPTSPVVAIASPPVTNEVAKPVIKTQPTAQIVRIGDPLVLRAEIVGAPALAYQWLKDTKPLANGTASALLLQPVVEGTAGDYVLVIKSAGGAVTSQVATVKVLPALPQAGKPWINSLGIPFVPLPGNSLLIACWETRVRDFERMPTNRLVQRVGRPGFVSFQKDKDEPVVMVSWRDATNYCAWLTELERNSNHLDASCRYRLPEDKEWSRMAGLPPEEQGRTPRERMNWWNLATAERRARIHPDPPVGTWNVAGVEWKGVPVLANQRFDPGHDDRVPYTAPVDSSATNALGLHHLFGNVSEWCQDELAGERWFRGASWKSESRRQLELFWRGEADAASMRDDVGFRLALEVAVPKP